MSLVYFESLTHREIAEQLGVTIEAVEKQVTRGRRLLKADLQAILDALR
jgi:DNA-directed RNA polymerase specialized sigma24 family protein